MCGGGTQTTTQSVSIPPEVMARYNSVNARAEEVAQQPFQNYSGEFVAPLNQTQEAGVKATSDYSQYAQPYFGAATGMTLSGAQDVGALNQGQIGYYMNPYIQSVVDPTVKALQQQQGQDLAQQQSQAIKSGAYGGDRAGIQRAVLQGQQGLATSQAVAPLFAQGYQQAVNTAQGQQGVIASDLARRMQAGQQLAGLGTAGQSAALQGAQAQIQAGTLGQQTQQAGDTAKYQQFLQERGFPYQQAQFLANIAMGTGALSGSTTTTEQPAGFFSDERLKENIKQIGETNDGQPIYRYNYKGDPRTQIGLMAQDVEQDHPEAVGESHGYKTVDYKKATDDAVRTERAYGGGLDVNAFGGAVMDPGSYAGGGLVSDTDLSSILASQAKFFGPYGQGMAGQGSPYQSAQNVIPQASLPIPKLVTAGSAPSPRRPGLSQAAETGSTISGLYKGGKEALLGSGASKDDPEGSAGLIGGQGKMSGKNIFSEASDWFKEKAKAHGGGVIPRDHYDIGGGLPYGGMSQGYDPMAELIKQGQSHYELPKPGAPPKPQEPLKDAMQTGSQLYSAGKMGSAAVNKAQEIVGKLGNEGMAPATGQAQTGITAMPVARPEGLGAVSSAAEAPTAAAATETLGAAAPTATAAVAPAAETLGAATTAAAPVAETAGATLAAAAPEAIAGAGTAAAAGAEELLPLLLAFAKRGGRINAHHYAQGGVIPRQGYADGSTVTPPDDPQKLFSSIEDQYGLPSGYLNRTWQIESGSGKNLGNDNSSARGHFQFIPSTAQMMGLKNPDDLAESADATARLAAQNRDTLRKAGIENPNAAQLYLAHQQGGLGASRLLSGADSRAGDIVGDRAVSNNAGDPNMKGLDFANKIMNMYSGSNANLGDQVRAAQTEKSAPAAKDTGTNWEKILVPLLSGVGSAMASQRPTLGGALGEGLMGGIAGYKDISKLQAELPKTQAETQVQLSNADRINMATRALRAGMLDAKFIPDVGLQVFDKENMVPITVTDKYGKPVAGAQQLVQEFLTRNPTFNFSEAAKKGSESAAAKKPEGAVASDTSVAKPPAADGSATPQQGSASDITKFMPPDVHPSEWNATTKIPEGYQPALQGAVMNPFNENRAKYTERGNEQVAALQNKALSAPDTQLIIDKMSKDLSTVNRDKFTATGPTALVRNNVASGLNEAARFFGYNPVIDPSNVASFESIQKGTANLGFKTANSVTNSRVPFELVKSATQANPQITNSPLGASMLLRNIEQGVQLERDKAEFFADYFRRFQNTEGAQEAFEKLNPSDKYVQRGMYKAMEDFIPQERRDYLKNYLAREDVASDPKKKAAAMAAFDEQIGVRGAAKILTGEK